MCILTVIYLYAPRLDLFTQRLDLFNQRLDLYTKRLDLYTQKLEAGDRVHMINVKERNLVPHVSLLWFCSLLFVVIFIIHSKSKQYSNFIKSREVEYLSLFIYPVLVVYEDESKCNIYSKTLYIIIFIYVLKFALWCQESIHSLT